MKSLLKMVTVNYLDFSETLADPHVHLTSNIFNQEVKLKCGFMKTPDSCFNYTVLL